MQKTLYNACILGSFLCTDVCTDLCTARGAVHRSVHSCARVCAQQTAQNASIIKGFCMPISTCFPVNPNSIRVFCDFTRFEVILGDFSYFRKNDANIVCLIIGMSPMFLHISVIFWYYLIFVILEFFMSLSDSQSIGK